MRKPYARAGPRAGAAGGATGSRCAPGRTARRGAGACRWCAAGPRAWPAGSGARAGRTARRSGPARRRSRRRRPGSALSTWRASRKGCSLPEPPTWPLCLIAHRAARASQTASEKLKGLLPPNRKVGYIFNALDNFPIERQKRIEADIAALIEVGLQAEHLDLRMYFNKEAWLRERVNQFGALWVSGGNVFVLRQAMKLSGLDIILNELNKTDDFLYGAYSAGVCVLSPSLDGYQIVDDATSAPYPELSEVIWEGLGIIDSTFLPHYKSEHSEASSIDKELEYCKERGISYKALSDGEVIIIE